MFCRCRTAPAAIRRQLRQEAYFGCAICGNPLLENAHIIDYHISKEFPVEDMVALCPNCHTEADLGHWPKRILRNAKEKPLNQSKYTVKKRFCVTGERTVVNVGYKAIDTERVLTVSDFDLISIKKEQDGFLSLNLNLFDKFNRFIAIVYENFWFVDRRYFWDIEYRPQHLTIRNSPRDITLDMKIHDEEVFIRGNLYYDGFLIPIKRDTARIGRDVLHNVTVENVGGSAISIQLVEANLISY